MNLARRYSWLWFVAGLALIAALIFLLARPSQTVRGKSPALPLAGDLLEEQVVAQELALEDTRVQDYTIGRESEVFGVHRVGDGHYPATSSACDTATCWQVEIYNFDEDTAVTAIVNVDDEEVLDVLRLPGMQPGINQRLITLAEEIAFSAPEVIEVLGFKPTAGDMAPVPSNLIGSSCEGGHLCGAITFELGDQVLWAIVDLTEEKLAGIDFTVMAPAEPSRETAEPWTIQDCVTSQLIERDGWSVNYLTTGSDGLMVSDVTFNTEPFITQAKVVEWHADYGSSGFVDATGCSPFGGFPIYPFGDTQIVDIMDGGNVVGFELIQDFRMSNWGNYCNYRYEQHYEFYNDGRFRIIAGAYGKGCGDDAMYRPVIRMDLAAGGTDSGDSFAKWTGSDWSEYVTEDWNLDTGSGYTPEGYLYRMQDSGGDGFYLETSHGQFPGERGDEGFMYVTQHNPAEGDTDMGTVGSCCNDNYQQGPHNYLNGESVQNENLVLWYVTQMMTDVTPGNEYCWTEIPNTWPCFSGIMFHPYDGGSEDVVYVSGAQAAMLGATAVPYGPGDILTYDRRDGTWSLFFDAEAAGLTDVANVNAFQQYGNRLLLSFEGTTNIPGIGLVSPADVVLYNSAANSFRLVMDGSDVGIPNSGGGIDALSISAAGKLLVSSGTPFVFDGFSTAYDEDVLEFDVTQWGGNTSGTFSMFIDGSDIGFGMAVGSSVRGLYVDPATNNAYFTFADAFNGPIEINRGDVAVCTSLIPGSDTTCTSVGVYWEGSTAGVGPNIVLDAIEIDTGAELTPLIGLSE